MGLADRSSTLGLITGGVVQGQSPAIRPARTVERFADAAPCSICPVARQVSPTVDDLSTSTGICRRIGRGCNTVVELINLEYPGAERN